jgi:hypothetical protein
MFVPAFSRLHPRFVPLFPPYREHAIPGWFPARVAAFLFPSIYLTPFRFINIVERKI